MRLGTHSEFQDISSVGSRCRLGVIRNVICFSLIPSSKDPTIFPSPLSFNDYYVGTYIVSKQLTTSWIKFWLIKWGGSQANIADKNLFRLWEVSELISVCVAHELNLRKILEKK